MNVVIQSLKKKCELYQMIMEQTMNFVTQLWKETHISSNNLGKMQISTNDRRGKNHKFRQIISKKSSLEKNREIWLRVQKLNFLLYWD